MMPLLLENQRGLTIIEVLLSAVIFMAGFSVLVALLNGTFARLSIRELLLARSLGHTVMVTTLANADTCALDTVVETSGTSFDVTRRVTVHGDLAEVLVTVTRKRTDRKLIELYNVFLLLEE
jgi:hypothetical protein